METLSLTEYSTLRQKQLEKGEILVPLYICSKGRQVSIRSMQNLLKIYSGMSLVFIMISVSTYTPYRPAKVGLDGFYYIMTIICNLINCHLLYKCKISFPQMTLSIHWDMKNEHFVIHRPIGLYGGVHKLEVLPENFKQLKDNTDPKCLYYDKVSGEKFSTVNEGQWYNQGLLYHIMTVKSKGQGSQ